MASFGSTFAAVLPRAADDRAANRVHRTMELVTASSTSVFKLCAFPSGAGSGSGGSEEPGAAASNAPVPTILAKWKPATGSVTTRPLGDCEAMVSLADGHSLISAHKLSDGPGSILFFHTLKFEMVTPPTDIQDPNSKTSSSKSSSSKQKEASKAKQAKPQPQPKITPSCLPLGALFRQTEQTVSLHLLPQSNRVLQVLSTGHCLIFDTTDIESLRNASPAVSSSNGASSKSSSSKKNKSIVSEFDLGQLVVSTRLNPFNPRLISVIGPHGTLASVYNIEEQKRTWRAKNVPHDTLRLEVPISDMDSDWIDENQLVVCTAHSHVRVYDVRDQRRPTLTFSVADEFAKSLGPSKFQQLTKGDVAFSLRQIACNPTNRTQVAVAANTGDVFILLTTRKADQGHIRSRQKGVQGAVRCLLFHPTRPNALIATGLDRFVRSWDASKSRSLGTLYTKLRQNCVVFTDVLAPILKTHKAKVKEAKKKKQEEEEEDSYEFDEDDFSTDSEQEMWQDLKVTGGSKKRQRASETEEDDATPVKKSKHK